MKIADLSMQWILSEEAYHEIESIINDTSESEVVKVTSDENGMKIAIISRSNAETISLFENHRKLFERVDGLIC